MSIKVHRFMADSRANGKSWADINGALGAQQQQWQNEGEGLWPILDKLGYTNAQLLRDDLDRDAMIARARDGG